jgi:ketosteroid isomerase-like protein
MKTLLKFRIMKKKLAFKFIMVIGLISASCEAQVDLINDEFPEEKQEVMETFNAIGQSIKDGDIDKLISFHAYGPKFTEFKNGEPRNGDEANEANERNVFGSVTEIVKFDAKDLKIAVYGDVANLTFHSDFHLKFGEDLVVVNDQITLLFVKTADGWKLVHEHHSPLKQENS